ncbi:MAG: redoxin domain-containing protein [Gemmatimonadaceae bacterium]
MSSAGLLQVGDVAPAFSARASDGATYSLAELCARGGLALFFYPGNDTPG